MSHDSLCAKIIHVAMERRQKRKCDLYRTINKFNGSQAGLRPIQAETKFSLFSCIDVAGHPLPLSTVSGNSILLKQIQIYLFGKKLLCMFFQFMLLMNFIFFTLNFSFFTETSIPFVDVFQFTQLNFFSTL